MLGQRGLHMCFCLCLQTVGLVSQARPFCSAAQLASSTHIQYAIGAATEIRLARLTCLSDLQVGKISAFKTMSETVQKTLKQQSTQRKCCKSSEKTKPEQPSICCCGNSLKTSAIVASSLTRYKPLRLLQICVNKKTLFFL